MPWRGEVTEPIDAPPDRIFAALVDVARFPAWTTGMTAIVDQPRPPLAAGTEWVAGWKAGPWRYTTKATVIEIDAAERRFVYREKIEQDNPSFDIWLWRVSETSDVTFGWDLRPVTFIRKRVIVPLHHAQLQRAMAKATLDALSQELARPSS